MFFLYFKFLWQLYESQGEFVLWIIDFISGYSRQNFKFINVLCYFFAQFYNIDHQRIYFLHSKLKIITFFDIIACILKEMCSHALKHILTMQWPNFFLILIYFFLFSLKNIKQQFLLLFQQQLLYFIANSLQIFWLLGKNPFWLNYFNFIIQFYYIFKN